MDCNAQIENESLEIRLVRYLYIKSQRSIRELEMLYSTTESE